MLGDILCRVFGHNWVRSRGALINPKCSRCGTFKMGKSK